MLKAPVRIIKAVACATAFLFFGAARVPDSGLYTGVDSSYYDNGRLWSVVSYVNGKMHGKYRLWYDTGAKWFEGNYREGKPYRTLMEFYPGGGRKFQVECIEDAERTTSWQENGNRVSVVEFRNGRPENKHTRWYDDGTIRQESFYLNGEREGTWSFYDAAGKLVREEIWNSDRLTEVREH